MADSTASAKKSSLLRAALEALSQGNYAEAIVCSKHALKQDRHSYDALLVLGKALFSSKQLDQAEIPYRRAAELNPDDVRAWRVSEKKKKETKNKTNE
jgi:superkiller protein 3